MKVFANTVHALTVALGTLCMVFVLLVMAMVTLNVTMRTLRGQPVPGVLEYGQLLLVAIVYFSIPYAMRTKSHVHVGLVTMRLSPRVRAHVEAIGLLVVLVALVWLTVASGQHALTSWRRGEVSGMGGMLSPSVWPARLAITLGLFVTSLEILQATLSRWKSDEEPEQVASVTNL